VSITSDPSLRLRRLWPQTGFSTVAQAAAQSDWRGGTSSARPLVALNMVATADGRATIAGRTATISDRADRELFHALREQADAVLVGAGTVRAERYGRLVRDPVRRERRRRRGLEPDPLACVVSGGLDLPTDLPLLADPHSRVLILTPSEDSLPACRASVEYLRAKPGSALELGDALLRLRQEWQIRGLLCEGGPHLNSQLLPRGLVDELYLSIAPKLAGGGDGLGIVAGPELAAPLDLDLLGLLESDGSLFARYAVTAPAAG